MLIEQPLLLDLPQGSAGVIVMALTCLLGCPLEWVPMVLIIVPILIPLLFPRMALWLPEGTYGE